MNQRFKNIFALHLLFVVYSLSSVLSKLAAGFAPLSPQFIGLYVGMVAVLGLYAIGWQQMLKRLPLITAYSNKAVTVVWGIVWGVLLFAEPVTIGKVAGAALIVAGVVLFSRADAGGAADGPAAPAAASADESANAAASAPATDEAAS